MDRGASVKLAAVIVMLAGAALGQSVISSSASNGVVVFTGNTSTITVSTFTNSIIPEMTASNAPSPFIASDINVSYYEHSSYPAWYAFDNSPASNGGTGWKPIQSDGDPSGKSLVIYMGASAKAVSLYQYTRMFGKNWITDWIIQGSANGTDWTDLHTVTGYVPPDPTFGTSTGIIAIPSSNVAVYAYVRFYITSTSFPAGCGLTDFKMWEISSSNAIPTTTVIK